MEDVGAQLKSARRVQKMTLKGLAQKSGVHWVTLSRFENGHADLGVRKLNRVAQALGLRLTLQPTQQGYTLDDLSKGFLRESDVRSSPSTDKPPLLKQVRGLRK